MIPKDKAREIYENDGRTDFDNVLEEHEMNGVVIDRHDCFALAKAIRLPDGDDRFAWLITVAAGNMLSGLSEMPFWLDWIAFHRHLKPRFPKRNLNVYPMARFIQKIQAITT
jgi:hypothetical protein